MTHLGFEWIEVRLAALILLVVYAVLVLALLPREMAFLKGVDQPYRRRFILQNVLIQVSVLMVLVPCAIAPKLPVAGLIIVTTGFVLLWVVVICTAFARYAYITHLLKQARRESGRKFKGIVEQLMQEDDTGE